MAEPTTPQEWYYSIPPVTRTLLTGCVATTCAVSLGMVDPRVLYLDWPFIWNKFQLWRLATNFFFLGKFSLPFVFSCYILYKYSSQLEKDPYPSGGGNGTGNKADYVFMLIICGLTLCLVDLAMGLPFLGSSLIFTIVYVWSRKNPHAVMTFFGFKFQGFYLPWVMLVVGILFGNDPTPDLMGIIVGHIYYFFQEVLPRTKGVRLLYTPVFLADSLQEVPSHYTGRPAGAGRPGAAPAAGRQAFVGQGRVLGREEPAGRPHED